MLNKVFGDEFVDGIKILIVDGFIYESLNEFLIVHKNHRLNFLACECLPSCLTLTLTGRGERMRASGPVEREVRQRY